MYYKVFIPSKDPEGYDVTITVDADNWMSALSKGLERTGEDSDIVRNVMCDIQDEDTFHVTDASTQRVFKLEEISEEEFEASEADEVDEAPEEAVEVDEEPEEAIELDEASEVEVDEEPEEALELDEASEVEVDEEPATEPPTMPETEPVADEANDEEAIDLEVEEQEPSLPETEPAAEEPVAEEGDLSVGSSTREELREKQDSEATVVDEKRTRTDEQSADDIGRKTEDDSVSETLIEDFFLEIQPIHEGDMSMEEVVDYVIDLVIDKIDAESGSVLFADTSGRELYFAAARGPKADEVMDFRVPMGEGIVGFCSREGVSLAIGDAQEDPRFYQEISESIGYDTDSLLCAPVQHEGRVYGAIELVNKEHGSSFSSNEMNALSYIGRQLAEYVNRVVMSRESLDEEE